ncbi:MAG: hypothetical protein GF309_02285 [Candidatus Lokiarchaeota archaeon]|nr:hypothetical protein [Candidatus Lokiarchaeota archaeon]
MLLSVHESVVWWLFQHNNSTSQIAEEFANQKTASDYVYGLFKDSDLDSEQKGIESIQFKDTQYVSRVLNRARGKIEDTLRNHAQTHRLDIESVQDYKGLLIGFDYQASTPVYIVFTMKRGVVIWYKHDSYAGKLCDGTPFREPEDSQSDPCPKKGECREVLDTIIEEYDIELRPDERDLYMTKQSIAIFNKLAAKEIPRYKRGGN